jgi:uncharacterized coiled-coil DUF342 family protein
MTAKPEAQPTTETPPAGIAAPARGPLKIVGTDIDEAAFLDETAKASAPMVQRLASHRDRMSQAVKELESERFDLISRRDLIQRQADALIEGLNMHIEDIDKTMRLYEAGMNSLDAEGQP